MLVEVCGGVVCDKMGLGVCGMNGGGGEGFICKRVSWKREQREREVYFKHSRCFSFSLQLSYVGGAEHENGKCDRLLYSLCASWCWSSVVS